MHLRLLYNSNPTIKQLAVAVASMWKSVPGIDTELQEEEYRVFLSSRKDRHRWDVVRLGWTADYIAAIRVSRSAAEAYRLLQQACANPPVLENGEHRMFRVCVGGIGCPETDGHHGALSKVMRYQSPIEWGTGYG